MADAVPTESAPVVRKESKALDKLVAKAKEENIPVSAHHLKGYLHEAAGDPSLAWDLFLEDRANGDLSVTPAESEPQVWSPEVEEIVKAWEDADGTQDEAEKQRKLESIIHHVKKVRAMWLTTQSQSIRDRSEKGKGKAKPRSVTKQYCKKQLPDQLYEHGCIDGVLKKLNKEPLEDATLNLLKRHDRLLERYKCVRTLLFGICDGLEVNNVREVVEKLFNGDIENSEEALCALRNKIGDAFLVETTEEEDKVIDIADQCYAALAKIEQNRRETRSPAPDTNEESANLKSSEAMYVVPEVSGDGVPKQSNGSAAEASAQKASASTGRKRKANVQKAKNARKN